MRLFACQNCSQMLFFENQHCEHCKRKLGYLPVASELTVVDPKGSNWLPRVDSSSEYVFCDNARYNACNWLVKADLADKVCMACRHNRVVPDLSVPENLDRWRKIEFAKHHLFYTLIKLGLPLANRVDDPENGLAFDFLTEMPNETAPVLTGHDHGLITLNIAEADDGAREQLRQQMGEPYRTLLGHFRHEVGHYFWDVLVDRGGKLEEYRAVFGDERPDYGEALKKHYADGAPPNWQQNFVSSYATAHSWEDFAETWAHYLHIVDTLEMAGSFGLRVSPTVETSLETEADLDDTITDSEDINALISAWLPVTLAVNSLNRCMGQPDLYPFVISETVVTKLGFIHDLVRGKLKPVKQRSSQDLETVMETEASRTAGAPA
jgi:hypothetical protein